MGLFMSKILYFAFLTLSLMPFVKSHHALLLGLILGIFFENPFPKQSAKISKQLLKLAVIGLGFGVPLYKVVEVGKNSILFTFLGIIFVIFTGYILGKYMKIEPNANKLISFGTAICGGSAIAALSPVINAEEKDIAVSLGIQSKCLRTFNISDFWPPFGNESTCFWSMGCSGNSRYK
jgi:uncharacterized membrane protein YadS